MLNHVKSTFSPWHICFPIFRPLDRPSDRGIEVLRGSLETREEVFQGSPRSAVSVQWICENWTDLPESTCDSSPTSLESLEIRRIAELLLTSLETTVHDSAGFNIQHLDASMSSAQRSGLLFCGSCWPRMKPSLGIIVRLRPVEEGKPTCGSFVHSGHIPWIKVILFEETFMSLGKTMVLLLTLHYPLNQHGNTHHIST